MKVSWFRSLLVLALLVTGSWASAQEEAAPAKSEDIATLIKQLDAESFADRQAASKKLAAEADKAIGALEKAAASDSRETSMRAFEILKNHFDKGQPDVKEAARQALDRIAKSDLGAASRRATEALTPTPAPAVPQQPNVPGVARLMPIGAAPGIRIAAARVAIAAGGVGGGVETKIKIEDGVKTTEVKDKDRKVKIVEDGDKSLQLEVTETKEGKEETKKYEVKNAEELKSKHAEAYKIYEQYAAKGGEIKIGGFGFAPAGGVVPALPIVPIAPMAIPADLPADVRPALPARGFAVPRAAGGIRAVPVPAADPVLVPGKPGIPEEKLKESFESLEKSLQAAEASLKDAAKASDSEEMKKSQEQLAKVRKELEQLRALFK